MQQVSVNPTAHPSLAIRGGLLFRNNSLVLSRTFSHIPKILEEFHSSLQGGHSGFFRTYKRISAVFYWEGMKQDIKDFISKCQACQQRKIDTLKPAGLLQPLPIPTRVWSDISMDFIGGLPRIGKKDTLLVVVDRLTKYAHFVLLGHPYDAKEVVASFCAEIVRLHGFPESIVSDRDAIFLSHFWKELFKLAGTKLKYSTHSILKLMDRPR